ncbi:beta-glucosidase Adg3 [Schizosaccharomyces japonicus yFS275]|uniref:Beta-glucosidase Adg3 n=1 Tax=Schizosaccharomyces japonicus (strain yFS275 / FY16936) TaxID=402676 RepID=B6K2L1_SCHJY|nr:beta-glucosidase Adg3 [Schizosaccharomyces japonicus yFS275]EEB07392.1 beta-glucosidase Adg3 [Schizosaccharomyces japonicus yFS275]
MVPKSLAFIVYALLTGSALARHTRRSHSHPHRSSVKARGSTQCAFPYADKMVAVTPQYENAGWAMSPDQPCLPGNYCPYACEPGYLMGQWDPEATTYSYPESMYGGLYCNSDGTMEKPYPKKDYCYPGVGNVYAVDRTGKGVSFCQTVLPGNEAMLIPTWVSANSKQVLAVPDTSYWAGTAAHYYINAPGVSTDDGCVWGTTDNPYGNWSPYVAGANMDANGITYVKLGSNPIYVDDPNWVDIAPTFGLRLECEGDGCSGLPCYVDPRQGGVQGCPPGSPTGAGGACFCVIGFPKGTSARIIIEEYGTNGTVTSSSSVAVSSSARASSAAATSSVVRASSSATPTTFATVVKSSSVAQSSAAAASSAAPVSSVVASSAPAAVSSAAPASSTPVAASSAAPVSSTPAVVSSVAPASSETPVVSSAAPASSAPAAVSSDAPVSSAAPATTQDAATTTPVAASSAAPSTQAAPESTPAASVASSAPAAASSPVAASSEPAAAAASSTPAATSEVLPTTSAAAVSSQDGSDEEVVYVYSTADATTQVVTVLTEATAA